MLETSHACTSRERFDKIIINEWMKWSIKVTISNNELKDWLCR